MPHEPITFADASEALPSLAVPGATVLHEISEGAYSSARRWIVELPDSRRVFVKAGRYPGSDHGLHLEAAVGELGELFHPRVIEWHEGDRAGGELSVLVLEDLSHARWRTPLDAPDVRRLAITLEQAADVDAPHAIPALDPLQRRVQHAWRGFAGDEAGALLATGLVDEAWLATHAGELTALETAAKLEGEQLVHGDLWMQNWCRLDDRGAVIVDWSSACRGNPTVNTAWAECAVRAAGGPPGIVFRPGPDEPTWAAWMGGRALDCAVWAAADPRPRVRETLHREAIAALAWVCEACELPRPRIAPHARVDAAWRP